MFQQQPNELVSLQEYTLSKLLLQLPSPPAAIQLRVQLSTDGDRFQSTGASFSLDRGSCPRALCSVMGQAVPVSVCEEVQLLYLILLSFLLCAYMFVDCF